MLCLLHWWNIFRSSHFLLLTQCLFFVFFFFSSRRRHTRLQGDWSSDVCSSDLGIRIAVILGIVLLMSAKPELWESIGIVGASFVLGLLPSLPASRRTASLDRKSVV